MVVMKKTKDVINALRNKYDDNGNAYAFLEQVGNATGFKCNRHADALAVQLWESRGLAITGFEVKVSRQDWVKELRHPEKADPIAKHCHSWYLVVGDKDIVQFGEIPMTWGLMVPHTKNTLKIVKPAVINKNPDPVDMSFMCAILRRATQQLTDQAIKNAEYSRGYDEGIKEGKEQMEYSIESGKDKAKRLEKLIEDFKNSSGVDIDNWRHDSTKIGNAVKVVLDGSYIKELESLEGLHNHAVRCAKSIEEEIKKHKESLRIKQKLEDVERTDASLGAEYWKKGL